MKEKNPAAVALGRKGGKAAAKNMTPAQRTARARNAAKKQTPEQRSAAAKKGWRQRNKSDTI